MSFLPFVVIAGQPFSVQPSNPESDLHLISRFSNTTESFIKIMRITKVITNLRSFSSVKEFSMSIPKKMYREGYGEY